MSASLQPSLRTGRLILRPFATADAPDVQRLAGAWEIADTTLVIPHPYLDGMAEGWIAQQPVDWENRESVAFAITERKGGQLSGAIGLKLAMAHGTGEMGYWIGVPFWGRGYATEAAREVTRFGFEQLGLNRVHAHHFVRNPASGRVLQKAGLTYEGRLRQHVRRWDRFEDLECYGILRQDWSASVRPKG